MTLLTRIAGIQVDVWLGPRIPGLAQSGVPGCAHQETTPRDCPSHPKDPIAGRASGGIGPGSRPPVPIGCAWEGGGVNPWPMDLYPLACSLSAGIQAHVPSLETWPRSVAEAGRRKGEQLRSSTRATHRPDPSRSESARSGSSTAREALGAPPGGGNPYRGGGVPSESPLTDWACQLGVSVRGDSIRLAGSRVVGRGGGGGRGGVGDGLEVLALAWIEGGGSALWNGRRAIFSGALSALSADLRGSAWAWGSVGRRIQARATANGLRRIYFLCFIQRCRAVDMLNMVSVSRPSR
jgi:hypothetical protein